MFNSTISSLLGNQIRILSGFAFSSLGFREGEGEGIPLIRIRDLGKDTTQISYIGSYDPLYLVEKEDILIGMDGDFEVFRWRGESALLNQRVCKIETTTSKLNKNFLFWFLKPQIKAIHRRTPQTTVRHLSINDINQISLPTICAEDQKAIATILDTLDDTIQKTEQLIAKLKLMKQGMLHDLLTKGIDENGELRDPVKHPEQFKDSPLGLIPKDWIINHLGDHYFIKGGKRLPAGHDYVDDYTKYRYLRVVDFYNKEIHFDELKNVSEKTFDALKNYRIEQENLYISIAGSIGFVGVFRGEEQAHYILTENAAKLVPRTSNNPDFVALQSNSNLIQKQISTAMGTGGGVPKLALFRIENLLYLWPSLSEQDQIVRKMNALTDQLQKNEIDLYKLKLIKEGLMNDLLSGNVRISEEALNG